MKKEIIVSKTLLYHTFSFALSSLFVNITRIKKHLDFCLCSFHVIFSLFTIFKNAIVFGIKISSINLERYVFKCIDTLFKVCFERRKTNLRSTDIFY